MHNEDGTIKASYENVDKAALALNVSKGTIKRIIGGKPVGKKYDDWHLKYGEKVKQLVIPEPIKIDYPVHKNTPKEKSTVTDGIDWYIGGKLFRSFDSVLDAARHFEVSNEIIRRTAIGKTTAFKYNLKYSKIKE